MADGTIAVPASLIQRYALCPACVGGKLQPFKIELELGGFQGYDYGVGWVVVCALFDVRNGVPTKIPGCGFSMPITAVSIAGKIYPPGSHD